MEYGNGHILSKDLNSKLELYIDPHAGLEYWGSTEGQKYLRLSTNIANFVKLVESSGLKLDNYNKLTIDIDVLKGLLHNILGDNLLYNSTTTKLDVKNYETVNILKGKMLIEDHSITYLNLQDKSGMKIDRNNNFIEIINYRNKLFEFKSNQYDTSYDTKYVVNNINPNESHLKVSSGYFESNIIEDYRITIFIVMKNNADFIFELYDNSDHSLSLLHIHIITSNTDNLIFNFNTTNILMSQSLVTNLSYKKKFNLFK